jgi:acetyl/propionyl-CoA carboxylase alpha subunit
MVHAADRDAAIDRLAAALAETEVAGIQTTLPFHRLVAGTRASGQATCPPAGSRTTGTAGRGRRGRALARSSPRSRWSAEGRAAEAALERRDRLDRQANGA